MNDGNDSKHLKVVGLKNNTDYIVHWFSFVEGQYIYNESDCQNTTSWGKFELQHPVLNPYSRPILWFVLEQANCQGSGMVAQNDETETQNSDDFADRTGQTDLESDYSSNLNPEYLNSGSLKLYPNPFSEELVIESQVSDRLSIYSPSGQLIQTLELEKGKTYFRTDILQKGLYLFQFENQNKIFKLVKN